MARSAFRGAVIGSLALPLVLAGTALGASVTIDEGPLEGQQVQTKSNGAAIPVDWTVNPVGCDPASLASSSLVSTIQDLSNPGAPPPLVTAPRLGQTSIPADGPARIGRNDHVKKNTIARWTMTFTCNDAANPAAPLVVTASRTFTLLAPDLRARATGRYLVTLRGTYQPKGKSKKRITGSRRFVFKPLCKKGPCKAKVNIRGLGNTVMKYNGKKKRWTGVLQKKQINKLFSCRNLVTKKVIVKNAYSGKLTVTLNHRRGKQRVVGAQTRSTEMVGRMSGTIKVSARGKARGCANLKVNSPLRARAF